MKIELSAKEVTYLVECCMRSNTPTLGIDQRELLLRLKFAFLDVTPFQRASNSALYDHGTPKNRRGYYKYRGIKKIAKKASKSVL